MVVYFRDYNPVVSLFYDILDLKIARFGLDPEGPRRPEFDSVSQLAKSDLCSKQNVKI